MREEAVIGTLAELVRINSVNAFYEGGPGEGEIGSWVRRFFESRGLEVREQEVFPGRNNVIARVRGRDKARCLILEAHMDTVSVKGMTIPPFDPRIEDGRMFGRGSVDTKAGLATMMHLLAELHEIGTPPACDVILAAAVDEEYSFRGVVKFVDWLEREGGYDLARSMSIVAEPTELRAVRASKGTLRWKIVVRGKSAHSAKPHLGVNAITHMSRLVLALEADHEALARRPHPLLGPATCNVGVIRGGVQVNFVPDECVIEIDRRMLPGETRESVLAYYQSLLDRLKTEHADFDAMMEPPMLVDEALETDESADVVRNASEALSDLGLSAAPVGVPFCSDASKLSRAGVPTIIFGPGSIDRAHGAVEYVELDQVERAMCFLRAFVKKIR
jgi:acetylornithine deacetylase/succinyl-diaminopimelate desuccinylase family protein